MLDAERAIHLRQIDHLLAEGFDEVDDVVGNVVQVVGQVGIGFCQLAQTTTLKTLVVGSGADAFRYVTTKLFGQLATRVTDGVAQIICVMKFASFFFYPMERVLEGYLCIHLCPVVLRNGILHGLEVEEIKRVGEGLEELANLFRRHQLCVVQEGTHLHLLYLVKLLVHQVLEIDLALIVQLALLLEVHTVEVEDIGLLHTFCAIPEETAIVWLVAVNGYGLIRFAAG